MKYKPLKIKDIKTEDSDINIFIGIASTGETVANVWDTPNEDIKFAHKEALDYAKLFTASPLLFAELEKLYNGLRKIANSRTCSVESNNAILRLTSNTSDILNLLLL